MRYPGRRTDGRNSVSITAPRECGSTGRFLVFSFSALLLLSLTGCVYTAASGTDEKARSELGYIKHEQDNIDVELRIFEGRLDTLEETLSLLKQDIANQQEALLRQVSGQVARGDERMLQLQSFTDEFSRDIRELKTQSNDLSASFSQYKRRFGEFEKVVDRHERNIENLEAAIRSLTAMLKAVPEEKGSSVIAATVARSNYRVRSGDTLEKIARAHNITVRQLKEFNQLKNDLIVVDQELTIPKSQPH